MDDQNSNGGAAPPVNRFLVFAVYFMGVALVLLFLGLIGGIIYKIKNPCYAAFGTGLVELGLPANTRRAKPFYGRQAYDQHGHGRSSSSSEQP